MKHVVIDKYGVFLGLRSSRLIIKKDGVIIKEIALNRLKTIQITQKGVSFSSDLIFELSARGIKLFLNHLNSFCAIHSLYEHKSVIVKKSQYEANNSLSLARSIILGKIKNQRATLLYSSRNKQERIKLELISRLDSIILNLRQSNTLSLEFILGSEGKAASIYFEFLRTLNLMPKSFTLREKKGSLEITNQALNYGYAILQNIIYKCVINAGLDPYYGVLHSLRSAKPSLVLDIMEEYRSFVVDRNVIKMRFALQNAKSFECVKKDLSINIFASLSKKLPFNHTKLSLESIMQRQIYKISGCFCRSDKIYRPYIFRW